MAFRIGDRVRYKNVMAGAMRQGMVGMVIRIPHLETTEVRVDVRFEDGEVHPGVIAALFELANGEPPAN